MGQVVYQSPSMTNSNLIQHTIGVFFGGQSPEHDVSILTGHLVLSHLKEMGYQVVPVYIARDGAWCSGDELFDLQYLKEIHTHDLYQLQGWFLDTRHRRGTLEIVRRPHFFSRREKRVIDIAFPCFHGAFGEDGTFQGLCEMIGVPYVGCDTLGSALSMDKARTKRLLQAHQLPTTAFVSFSKQDWGSRKSELLHEIETTTSYPVFVKPTHAGSSIGISKVRDFSSLEEAIEAAFTFDTDVLVESGVSPMKDLTCCVRQVEDGSLQSSLIQESSFGKSDFFTYEEKYIDGQGQLGGEQQLTVPAAIPDDTTREIQSISQSVIRYFGLSGIARVDFLLNPDTNELFVNEINTLPGTLYHHLWKKTGVDTSTLLEDLLTSALYRHEATSIKHTYFASSILEAGTGGKKGSGKIHS